MLLRLLLSLTLLTASVVICRAEGPTAALENWVARASKLKSAKVKFTQNRYLKSVHKPLVSQGEVSFLSPSCIRMESGNPAKMIATLDKTGTLTMQYPQKKQADVLSPTALEEMAGGQGVALLQGGFPKSMDDWKQRFEILDTTQEEGGNVTKISTKLAGKYNPVIQKVDFFVQTSTGTLDAIHFYFRDGSRIENKFTETAENVTIPESTFTPDLTGYEITKK